MHGENLKLKNFALAGRGAEGGDGVNRTNCSFI